jgi:hypothetical protein
MRLTWRPVGRRLVLSGEVLSVRLTVTLDHDFEREAWHILGDVREKLRSEIIAVTQQNLGPEFDVRSMTFARGSIEILVTIGAVYYAVSRYKPFVESVELFVSQLTGVVRRFFHGSLPLPSQDVAVSATWSPGPAFAGREAVLTPGEGPDWAFPLLWYLIVSHAALIAVLIWILVGK